MKRLVIALLCGALPLAAHAQEELLKMRLDTRVDYQREYLNGQSEHGSSGFKGKYLVVAIDGKISEKWEYAYRQRLNKAHADQSFFDATDWATVSYKPSGRWRITAGKDVVWVGGYEYDRNPVDMFAASEFWNNISCYQLGVSAAYTLPSGRDKIVAQYCQSPFSAAHPDTYAYNLVWYGNHGCLGTIYSANMIEYMPGHFISYIALGHKLTLGRLEICADFMNRAASGQTFLFADCSVMAELAYNPTSKLNLFGKLTYDVNSTTSDADRCVAAGTEITNLTGGVSFSPHKAVRLHAAYSHSFGTNTAPDAVIRPDRDFVSVGLTWKLDLLSLPNPWKKTND